MTSQTQILLVEDDQRLVELISDYLKRQDFNVATCERGDLAISQIVELQPDIVILDLNLPGKDGLSVCREVRHKYKGSILMLTAREEDVDQVAGLELGADDYVKKPIEPRVLLARIRALLRRSPQYNQTSNHGAESLEFGLLQICLTSRRVTLENQQVDLTSSEYDLLSLLAESAGSTLSREHLFKSLRGIEYDGLDRSMDVNISRLRKKLGDSSSRPFRIKTIWGQGYLFVPDAWY